MRRSRLVLLVLVGLVLVVGLRLVPTLTYRPEPVGPATAQLVVVGVTGRTTPTGTDRQVLAGHPAQLGAVSIRPTRLGACATAGWATLGAGRRADVGGWCDVRTTDVGVVLDWRARTEAIAADHGDARLGTLSDLATRDGGDCVAAVGPGAALAAANPDGTNTAYQSVDAYVGGGFTSACPITLVDAGDRSDEVISGLVDQPDTTVVVTGIGPRPGSSDPALQLIYRTGDPTPGWLTASSTRRTGVVQLTDLTRTMIDFAHRGNPTSTQPAVDGAPLQVVPTAGSTRLTADDLSRHLAAVAAQSDVPPGFFVGMGIAGVAALLVIVLGLRSRRLAWPDRILTAGAVCLATMMLVGVTRWWATGAPVVVLTVAFAVIIVGLTWVARRLARASGWPPAVVACAVTAIAFTAEALSGGWAEPGSLINSRPVFAWRWYGFGNVTFAAYATATLVLAGALAARQPRAGVGPRALDRVPGWRAAGVVLLVGVVMIIGQGWPTMGSDFGGVVAMVPGLLWLAVRVAGVRVRWWLVPVLGLAAVVAVGVVAWLDWLRAPDARSHLGRFVQRLLDGDATDLVVRKGVAMIDTVVSPLGIGAVVIGVVAWVLVFRAALPRLEPAQPTLVPTAVAVLVTAVLGTVVNDGGISVWITATAAFVVVAAGWLVGARRRALAGDAEGAVDDEVNPAPR